MRHATALVLAAILFAGCSKKNELAEPPPDAIKTPSGISSKILRVGLGETHPGPQSTVTVHYTGWTAADGQEFDSSMRDGKPITFRIDEVITGWKEALQLMRVGEKRRVWIPGSLAYDNSPRQDAPRGTLVFDIELIRIH